MLRGSWLTDMAEAVDGFVPDSVSRSSGRGPAAARRSQHRARWPAPGCARREKLTAHETPFLKAHAAAPHPLRSRCRHPRISWSSSYKPGITERAYPTPGSSSSADVVADRSRRDRRGLSGEGVPYIQLDKPYYTTISTRSIGPPRRCRNRSRRECDDNVAADNAAIPGLARNVVTNGIHYCRGNSRGRWYKAGGYDSMAETSFSRLDVDHSCSSTTPSVRLIRAAEYMPPKGKMVVLGLITTKTPASTHPTMVRRRTNEASHYMPSRFRPQPAVRLCVDCASATSSAL